MTETPSNSSTKIVLILAAGVVLLGFACCGGGGTLTWYVASTYERFVVPQNGMYPNIPKDSRFIAVRNPYADAAQVRRGDVVVFSHREDGKDTIYVSHIIGLPGDAIQTPVHFVSVNGKKLPLEKKRTEGDFGIFIETNGLAQYEVAYEANPPRSCRTST